MRIVQISTFEESVPPKKYGGVELVIYNLIQEFSKRGHKVFLIGTGDSKTNAEILPVFERAIRTLPEAKDMKIRDSLKFVGAGKILEILQNVKADIIHNHLGWRLFPFLPLIKIPVVTTLHGPLDIKYQQMVYGRFKKENYVSISNSQRRPFPDLNYAATVYNGIEIEKFPFSERPGNYLAFLGRMSPEKGPVQAIEVAKRVGMKLKMAAKVDAVDIEFFEANVKPLIDNKQVEFLGEIGHKAKTELLKNALALLTPIQWHEPFGLYFIEAMACGTPVIALNKGSVPEIIKDGETGFIANSTKEMTEAVKNIKKINRHDCRARVEKYFTSEKMAAGYEKVYYKILGKKK